MDTELARSIAAVNAEVRQTQLRLPAALGLNHPALVALHGALGDISDALGAAVEAAATGDRQDAIAVLAVQESALRATAAYVVGLGDDEHTTALTVTLAGIADLTHLLTGGNLLPPG